ncbi:MAG: helix-turn-helix transcriptional regulator [Candidatus Delongbacteria bacterium]|jgi:transcriptional regulator with XRE-family HTH domain|nr:helix-turn-helix transcriptional regulator [Candidatus Delongbacteria bacterium]
MTGKEDKITRILSDSEILKRIGLFIKQFRLEQNKSQVKLAKEAGISRTRLSEFERGNGSNTITLIRLLRALDKLNVLEPFEIRQKLSPIKLAKMERSQRKRASKQKITKKKNKSDW